METTEQQNRPYVLDLGRNIKYTLSKKIGSGAFGVIYEAVCKNTGKQVAVKIEKGNLRHLQLEYETKVYSCLKGTPGIPAVFHFVRLKTHNVMVMELLGPNTEDLFNLCNRKFTLKTVLMLAEQMLTRIEYLHYKHFIHRDIKPDNFVVGLGSNTSHIYLIDFGLAKRFRDPRSLNHVPYAQNKSLTGTARYASINTHSGKEQSRRDDLESLGHIIVYFLKGSLPWQGLKANTKDEKYAKILSTKLETPLTSLCDGLPKEIYLYFVYVRALVFDERPDYAYLRRLFDDVFFREKIVRDGVFDWTPQGIETQTGKKSLFTRKNI